MSVAVDIAAFARAVPKVELHHHLESSVRPGTAAELTRRHGLPAPPAGPGALDALGLDGDGGAPFTYSARELQRFLAAVDPLLHLAREREDFTRIACESLEDGNRDGDLRYREMFFSPLDHLADGVPYPEMVDGLIEGVRAAGVERRLIASINRGYPPAAARALVERMLEHPRDEVIGLGLDALTPDGREVPEHFAEAFALARSGGLHRTAHVAENADAPAGNIVTALDVLGCERIDHGYGVLRDPAVLARAREDGVVFCVSTTATLPIPAVSYGPGDLRANPIRAMLDAGLRVTPGTDGMPGVTPADEYALAATGMELDPADVTRMVLDGVDATWLDDGEKRRMRTAFAREIEAL